MVISLISVMTSNGLTFFAPTDVTKEADGAKDQAAVAVTGATSKTAATGGVPQAMAVGKGLINKGLALAGLLASKGSSKKQSPRTQQNQQSTQATGIDNQSKPVDETQNSDNSNTDGITTKAIGSPGIENTATETAGGSTLNGKGDTEQKDGTITTNDSGTGSTTSETIGSTGVGGTVTKATNDISTGIADSSNTRETVTGVADGSSLEDTTTEQLKSGTQATGNHDTDSIADGVDGDSKLISSAAEEADSSNLRDVTLGGTTSRGIMSSEGIGNATTETVDSPSTETTGTTGDSGEVDAVTGAVGNPDLGGFSDELRDRTLTLGNISSGIADDLESRGTTARTTDNSGGPDKIDEITQVPPMGVSQTQGNDTVDDDSRKASILRRVMEIYKLCDTMEGKIFLMEQLVKDVANLADQAQIPASRELLKIMEMVHVLQERLKLQKPRKSEMADRSS
jgi:hypothetical protein